MVVAARKLSSRFLNVFGLSGRLSGPPRSQFFTRCAKSRAPAMSSTGVIV